MLPRHSNKAEHHRSASSCEFSEYLSGPQTGEVCPATFVLDKNCVISHATTLHPVGVKQSQKALSGGPAGDCEYIRPFLLFCTRHQSKSPLPPQTEIYAFCKVSLCRNVCKP